MKKEIKDKIIETGCFFICVGILLAIAYYTGFLKGFTVADIQDAYNRTVYNFSKSARANKDKVAFLESNSKNNRKITSFKGYRVMYIPASVLRGVSSSGAWQQIFNSDKKVVFYLYSANQKDFHNSVQNYLGTKSKKGRFNCYAYTADQFSSMRVGEGGASKICDSLDECNMVSQKASDYTALSEFLKLCGKTMCIIKPSNGQYVMLKSKNSGQAVKMINDLVNW